MEEILKEKQRVVIVGAGDPMAAMIIRKLLDAGIDARAATEADVVLMTADSIPRLSEAEIVRLIRAPEVVPDVPLVLAERACHDKALEHGWYQQFAGRRGRPRRY